MKLSAVTRAWQADSNQTARKVGDNTYTINNPLFLNATIQSE